MRSPIHKPHLACLGLLLLLSNKPATAQSTIIDLNPGGGSSFPDAFVALRGQALFFSGPLLGADLWTTDGTAAGTRQLVQLDGGPSGYSQLARARIGQRAVWLLASGPTDLRLLLSDGTAAGTTTVPIARALDSTVRWAEGASSHALLTVDSKLWWTDGTPAGTTSVELGPDIPSADMLVADGESCFVLTRPSTNSSRVWHVTPASGRKTLLGDFPNDWSRMIEAGPGRVLLSAHSYTLPTTRLYVAGPSAGSLRSLAQVGETPIAPLVAHGYAIALSEEGFPNGTSLRSIDLDTGSTQRLAGLGPMQRWSVDLGRIDGDLVLVHDSEPPVLIRTDGTVAGTSMFDFPVDVDFRTFSNSEVSASLGDTLLFRSVTGFSNEFDLWATDGTAAGTRRLAPDTTGQYGPFPRFGAVVHDADRRPFAAFQCKENTFGTELWIIDLADLDATAFESVRPGCAGIAAEQPTVDLRGAPRLGTQPFHLQVQGADPFGAIGLAFGTALRPVSIDCTLQPLDFAILQAAADSGGNADFPIRIPNDPAYAGVRLYVQAGVGRSPTPGAPTPGAWLGVIDLSDCFALTLGF